MKWYKLLLWTGLVAISCLVVVGIMSNGVTGLSFSGKHEESGWPLVYSIQEYTNTSIFARAIVSSAEEAAKLPPEPPRPPYILRGPAVFDLFAFCVDLGVALLMVAPPAALCGWFLSRWKSLLLLWTSLVAVSCVAVVGIQLHSGTVKSLDGIHMESGWPSVFWVQDYDIRGFATPPEPPKPWFIPKGPAVIDLFAFCVDVGVALLIVAPPAAFFGWFMMRRNRLLKTASV